MPIDPDDASANWVRSRCGGRPRAVQRGRLGQVQAAQAPCKPTIPGFSEARSAPASSCFRNGRSDRQTTAFERRLARISWAVTGQCIALQGHQRPGGYVFGRGFGCRALRLIRTSGSGRSVSCAWVTHAFPDESRLRLAVRLPGGQWRAPGGWNSDREHPLSIAALPGGANFALHIHVRMQQKERIGRHTPDIAGHRRTNTDLSGEDHRYVSTEIHRHQR